MTPSRVLLAVLVLAAAAFTQVPAEVRVRRVLDHPATATALAAIDRDHDRMIEDIVTLTEVPAPPFQEARRAAAFRAMLQDAGLAEAEIDEAGNVVALRRGTRGGPLVAVAAHLDTVFPEGTDVRVRRTGTRLEAPGVGDASRSLAVLLAIVRALGEADVKTTSDMLFVGTVGEEGAGNLRGVRHLFAAAPYRDRIGTFIAIDGTGPGTTIVDGAVGSRRYRVTYRGPGGHSYGSFGLVNPAFAMAAGMRRLSRLAVPPAPRTTFNVGVVGGGTSVNSIPFETWLELDVRSESAVALKDTEAEALVRLEAGADEENAVRSTAAGPITFEATLVGDRPAGRTPREATLVQTAAAVVQAFGQQPVFTASSTDANLPISLGIPAITIESGGTGGQAHALDEWIDVAKPASLAGIRNALVLLLATAGLE